HISRAIAFQFIAKGGGPAILPDDGVGDRPPRAPIPDDGRFALVGDADASKVRAGRLRGAQHLERRAQLRLPNLLRIMLDPARLRKNLSKLALGRSDDGAGAIEKNGA